MNKAKKIRLHHKLKEIFISIKKFSSKTKRKLLINKKEFQ